MPVLQAGRDPFSGGVQTASVTIAQSDPIPPAARSMTFVTGPNSHDFIGSLNGMVLPCQLPLSSSSSQHFAVDVSAYAGQFGALRFTSVIPTLVPFNNLYLDNMAFVPEPSVAYPLALGVLPHGGRPWKNRQK